MGSTFKVNAPKGLQVLDPAGHVVAVDEAAEVFDLVAEVVGVVAFVQTMRRPKPKIFERSILSH